MKSQSFRTPVESQRGDPFGGHKSSIVVYICGELAYFKLIKRSIVSPPNGAAPVIIDLTCDR